MAKKEDIALTIQKLANSSAKSIQDSINKANTQALNFNAKEAEKARLFNQKEAATARNFNAKEAEIARLFNANEAKVTREWQTQMSNTAHQREVADLRKAGLNPVLSATGGGGAQSYTSASASAQSASAGSASSNNASGSVDSGAGALGSIFSGLMNSLAGIKNAQTSADAQMRSAQLSAQASKYVADRNSAATMYAADKAYQAQMEKPQSSPFGIVDKYLGKAGADLSKSSKDVSWKNIYYKKVNDNTYDIRGDYTAQQKRIMSAGLIKLGYNRNFLDSLSKKQTLTLYDAYFAGVVKGHKGALEDLKDKIAHKNKVKYH